MSKALWTQAFPDQMRPAKPGPRRVKAMSAKRKQESPEYLRRKAIYLADHPWCAWGLWQGLYIPATEIHHTRGRDGRLYLNEKYWLGVGRVGHRWIDSNMEAARAARVKYFGVWRTLLCQRGQWGRQ